MSLVELGANEVRKTPLDLLHSYALAIAMHITLLNGQRPAVAEHRQVADFCNNIGFLDTPITMHLFQYHKITRLEVN